MEGRIVGKPTRSRRLLEDLKENNSYKVLKRTAKDRSAWKECTRKKVPKPAVQHTTKEEGSLHVYITTGTSQY